MHKISFSGCWAKINRAKEHREALDAYIVSTFRDKANRATLRADLDPQSGYHTISIQSVPDLTPYQERVGIIVGDIVQNLRSALDHLTFQLVLFNTNEAPSYPRRAQFPIEDCKSTFNTRCKKGDYLGEVDPKHQAVIEEFQPYHGRTYRGVPVEDTWTEPYIHQLALLRDLSDQDKHRVLSTVILVPQVYEMSVAEIPLGVLGPWLSKSPEEFQALIAQREWETAGLDRTMELGATVFRARLVGKNIEPHMDMVGYTAPQVGLKERGPVIEAIDRITAYVSKVLHEFERLF